MDVRAGIDTWAVCWYLRPDSSADRAAKALATKPSRRLDFLPDPVAGHRVGYSETYRLLKAEGHPNPDGLGALDPHELQRVVDKLGDELSALGIEVPREEQPFNRSGSPGFAGASRLDLTADVRKPAEVGQMVMSGIAVIQPQGRLQSVVHHAQSGRAVETVAWKSTRGLVARVYDKGIEAGTHARGERLRLEDQRRVQGFRIPLEAMTPDLGTNWFGARFAPLWRATKGIKVTGPSGAAKRVKEAVDSGEITGAQGLKVLGLLIAEREGIEIGSRSTRYRNRRAANELGVVLSDFDHLEIDLEEELEAVLSAEWTGSSN